MQCLHITHMAIYTLVGLKPQSKHIYSGGTAAITSQWAKLQYTSELFIQTDLWQSHIHCVIPAQEESCAPRAGRRAQPSFCCQDTSAGILQNLNLLPQILLFSGHSQQQHEMYISYLACTSCPSLLFCSFLCHYLEM